ncbi:hypothetical protein CTAYLR_006292 [Chrysophaeum taylorii]|uniref:Rieske domain-containing protein n=1 Tax=Chrysophaeum taylorii TaxID=2483200 RepID=A0AAD7ULQ1_9STRA|nr:hypothetical protein CTAYLR_006292 [Chrysophaeum taylorii]
MAVFWVAAAAVNAFQLPEYKFREQWYAACFERDVPKPPEPMSFSVFDEAVVLWRDGAGIRCVADRCPHRLAALSQGSVEPDGSLRCFYHGWAFDGDGKCVAIPQLPRDATIPKTACARPYPTSVREGIVWVWMGDELPHRSPPATADDLDENWNRFRVYDFPIDLPYDHSFLVENLADPAHIPISHDRTEGGGRREDAHPYEFKLEPLNLEGFRGGFRRATTGNDDETWVDVVFEAPGIVRYRGERGDSVTGTALHCMPLGKGKSRLLFRSYFSKKGPNRLFRILLSLKPHWLRHLNSCKVLEQDLGLITSQEDYLASPGARAMAHECLPLASSDAFVVAYRKWLDAVGETLPYAPVGWKTKPVAATDGVADHVSWLAHRVRTSRLDRHVKICQPTRDALARTRRVRDAAIAAAFCLLSTATLFDAWLVPATAVGAAMVAGISLRLERAFYRNFDRHKWRPY